MIAKYSEVLNPYAQCLLKITYEEMTLKDKSITPLTDYAIF